MLKVVDRNKRLRTNTPREAVSVISAYLSIRTSVIHLQYTGSLTVRVGTGSTYPTFGTSLLNDSCTYLKAINQIPITNTVISLRFRKSE